MSGIQIMGWQKEFIPKEDVIDFLSAMIEIFSKLILFVILY